MIDQIKIQRDLDNLRFRYNPLKYPRGYYQDFVMSHLSVDPMMLDGLLIESIKDGEERRQIMNFCAVRVILKNNKKLIRTLMQTNSYLRTIAVEVHTFDFDGHIESLKSALAT